jgi:adenosylcobinamide amidohydrolase
MPHLPEVNIRAEDGLELAALIWRLRSPMLAVSTAACGGGLGPRDWVVNAQVPGGYSRVDLDAHSAQIAAGSGLTGSGVGMFTAVDVRHFHPVEIDGAAVVATVGVTEPAWAAAPSTDIHRAVGTINVVARLPVRIADGGLVNLVATITEAKCQALAERGVPGTGTPSDAVTVLCPLDGEPAPFGGPRSQWGSRLARATHGAILTALDSGALP